MHLPEVPQEMTDLITWSDKLSVSIDSVDNQHKHLVDMVNELNAAMSTASGNEVMGDILKRLINYTATHFQHEENLMQKHGYPGYAEHKRQHDELVEKVMDLQKKFENGNARMTIEVMMFLKNWLTEHIQGSDAEMGRFLATKQVA